MHIHEIQLSPSIHDLATVSENIPGLGRRIAEIAVYEDFTAFNGGVKGRLNTMMRMMDFIQELIVFIHN